MSDQQVYVVLGESGEYSDRSVWVSGVFDNETLAKSWIEKRSGVRRVYEQWWKNVSTLNDQIRQQKPYYKFITVWSETAGIIYKTIFDEKAYTEAEEIVDKLSGPAPENELGERFELVKIMMNTWNKNLDL